MKSCGPHWEKLKAAVAARGLSHWIAKDSHEAIERLRSELNQGSNEANFDPLMAANYLIWSRRLQMSGLEMLLPGPDGEEQCPVCCKCGQPGRPGGMAGWMDGCADDVLEQAKKLWLVRVA